MVARNENIQDTEIACKNWNCEIFLISVLFMKIYISVGLVAELHFKYFNLFPRTSK